MWKGIISRTYTFTDSKIGRSGSTVRAGGGWGVGTRRESSNGLWDVWRRLYTWRVGGGDNVYVH